MLISFSTLRYQTGALLAMSIILLVILTIMATTFTRVAQLELHGAKNYADRLATLVAAENTLSIAEQSIIDLAELPVFSSDEEEPTPTGFYESGTTPDPFDEVTWSNDNIVTTTEGAYFIEVIQTIPVDSTLETLSVNEGGYGEDTTLFSGDIIIFRTIVRAPNPSGNGFVMIESFYDRTF